MIILVSRRIRYGITNFAFTGTEFVTEPLGPDGGLQSYRVLPLNLASTQGSIKVIIRPHRIYNEMIGYLDLYSTIKVTCYAEIDLEGSEFDEKIDGVIGALCNVTSVARGTRIVWVYRLAYDEHNQLAGMLHLSGWPGRFFSLSIFSEHPVHVH